MINMSIDNDEKFENMCDKCKESSEQKTCISCGTKLITEENINPNFDNEFFEKMKNK